MDTQSKKEVQNISFLVHLISGYPLQYIPNLLYSQWRGGLDIYLLYLIIGEGWSSSPRVHVSG